VNSSSTESGSLGNPKLSVVVVAIHQPDLLGFCLEALTRYTSDVDVETLVVSDWRRPGGRPKEILRSTYPMIRWIDASGNPTVPRMRAMAIAASTGDIVAIIEDDCFVQPGWSTALLAAHRAPVAAVGGAVEPGAYGRALDWAVYFCDYGRFMLPFRAGPAVALPGNNMSYKREHLAQLPPELADDFQEAFIHRAWQHEGVPMRSDPTIVVTNNRRGTTADVTSIPYHHGRAFGGRRYRGQLWRRVMMSALLLFIPPLKVLRIVSGIVARGHRLASLVRALPWIVVLSFSWSIGEGIGYLRGPGASGSRWR